jgi:hypothetical protein
MVIFTPQPLHSQEKIPALPIEQEAGWATFTRCCGEERWAPVWVLWRGEMGCNVGAVERRDGLQCGCCGEERWAAMWVLWRGEVGCSVGAVERRDGLQ